jgi:predicted RND superfamily exporter protein
MSANTNKNQSEKCAGDIYANFNYDVVRNENLNKTEQLYNNLLNQYTNSYSSYLSSQTDAMNNPNNREMQNKKDMMNVQTKPVIKNLNQQLINVETALLDNNKTIRQNIEEQKKQMEIDSVEKDTIDQKIAKLEQLINMVSDTNDTGKYGVKDLELQFNSATSWYYVMIFINLVLFIMFCVLFYQIINE